nr:aminotransferase class V-fold PLP-dependent enzyme [Neobacillus sp. Marseille-Q6967]
MIRARIGSNTYQLPETLEEYFQRFRTQVIGIDHKFETPYGEKKIIYADWTASGRLYRPIEKKLTEVFGPFMANTHTESNITSQRMTGLYKQARKIIKQHVHADENDVLILDGFGMTSVMNKLQRILGLRVPETWKNKIKLAKEDRPIVFITHMEHHSNQTSWLETIADVEIIPPGGNSQVNVQNLEILLKKYKNRPLKIGSFTACSNVTGIQTPYHQMAKIMHQYGGICIIDFAASAPYVSINMHPRDPLEKLDAIVFSPHKFLGGPGSSGVLLFDKRLYSNKIPDHPGGGTVTWTNPWGDHQYFQDIELREDGGTPGILQAIRTALCLQLKNDMGVTKILKREKEQLALLLPELEKVPGLHVLEKECKDRLGIVSFFIDGIHYNLLVRLLNDRFGFQVRGGCSCAGTYGHYLLNIDKKTSMEIADKINHGEMSIKPGWVRFSLHPIISDEEIQAFVHALKEITVNIEEWKKEYAYDAVSTDYFRIQHVREDTESLFQLK